MLKFLSIISLMILTAGCDPSEDCHKYYLFQGIVRNNALNPASGVDVIFTRGTNTIRSTSAADGSYSFEFSNRGDITGFQIGFNVSGVEVVTSTPLTAEEVAPSTCGSHPAITRDVTLP